MNTLLSKRVVATVLGKMEIEPKLSKKVTPDYNNQEKRDLELLTIQSYYNNTSSKLIFCNQVHEDTSILIKNDNKPWFTFKDAPEADALFTMDTGLKLIIRTADCLPLFFSFESQFSSHTLAGVIHAGWRSMEKEIIFKTLQQAKKVWDNNTKSQPFRLIFAIGPAIGKDVYEVGKDVCRNFTSYSPLIAKKEKYLLDLTAEARIQVQSFRDKKKCLVLENNVLLGCTMAKNDYFYSHRQGDSFRNQNIIEILH